MDNLRAGIPVQVHLETNIVQDDQSSSFVFDVSGQLVQIGESIYIRYNEDSDDQGKVPVTIKIMPNGSVKLTRSASNRLQLIFIKGKRVAARYQTPYGPLDIQTVTPMMEVEIKNYPLRGRLDIDYLLYAGSDLLGKYNIRLQFTV